MSKRKKASIWEECGRLPGRAGMAWWCRARTLHPSGRCAKHRTVDVLSKPRSLRPIPAPPTRSPEP